MTRAQTLQSAFDAVNRRDADGIMTCWSETGTYDNPMLSVASTGHQAVRQRMVELLASLAQRNQTLVVDALATGSDGRVYAQWHVEPPDGRRGIHVAEFDERDRLRRVTVYLHKRG